MDTLTNNDFKWCSSFTKIRIIKFNKRKKEPKKSQQKAGTGFNAVYKEELTMVNQFIIARTNDTFR